MEENLEDIATGGKLNASLPGCRITEDAKHDMITMKETFWGSYKSHVSSCYAKTIFETTSSIVLHILIYFNVRNIHLKIFPFCGKLSPSFKWNFIKFENIVLT